jgi:hypothetical protein
MSLNELEPGEVWRDIWVRLARATRDRRHSFRHPVVATHCPRLGVRARTVVLRHAEPKDARLSFYTDCRSGKLEALGFEPSLSWCFYDGRRRVQVRAESRATVHIGDATSRAAWARQSPAARALYAIELAPATRLTAGETPRFREGPDAGFESFAVVVCVIEELDWLHLGREAHRRIRFTLGRSGWQGAWVVP